MKRKVGLIPFGLVLGALMLGGSSAIAESNPGNASGGLKPIVKDAIHQDVLRSLAAAPAVSPAAPSNVLLSEEVPKLPTRGRASALGQDSTPGVAAATGRAAPSVAAPLPVIGIGPAAPSPTVNFEGIDRTDSPANRFLPPDTQGAAGADFYLQMVNVTFAIYDKAGHKLMGPLPEATVFAGFGGPCETTEGGDIVTLYDRYANRFLFTKLAYPTFPVGPFYQCIAVSVTADPRGAWNRYSYVIGDQKFNDYPKFGVWPDGYYYTANQYENVTTPNEHIAGVAAGVFERDKMLLGLPARLVLFDTDQMDHTAFAMLPSDLEGALLPPAGSPNFFVNLKNEVLSDNDSTRPLPTLQVWQFQVDWSNPNNSSFTGPDEIDTMDFNPNFIAAQCSDSGAVFPEVCVPQPPVVGGNCTPTTCPNPNQKLDSIPDRLMYRLQYRRGFDAAVGEFESLVSNHNVNVGTSTNRAGIHWFQLIQTPNSSWSMNQQNIYAPDDGNSRWMGSIAMDEAGNIALGYSTSSPTTFPSIRYTGRKWADPLGTLFQGETTLVNGTGSQGHPAGRWGDYSAMVIDPLDDCSFWYTTEYMKVTSRADWDTRIGSFHFDTCGVRNTH